jgi:hypothetical protein
VLRSAGTPLDRTVRADLERRYDHDFSRVRVHADGTGGESAVALGAAAYTAGQHVVFGPGRYQPGSPAGRELLAHELAHVVQQGPAGPPAGRLAVGPVDHAAERQAGAAAAAVARGGRPGRLAPVPAGTILRSPLSDDIAALATEPKGRVFDLLRERGPAASDGDAMRVIWARFGAGTDDRWLAEQLLARGPEPRWPESVITERVARAARNNWAPEPGNIRAELPYPAEAAAGRIPPVVAHFFPGSTAERALVIGGIHGSEVQGARTVEALRVELAARSAAGRPPRFTTILVPVLNPRIHDPALRRQKDRYLPRRREERAADRATRARETAAEIEPNRSFPAPGESYAEIRARAATGGPELEFTGPRRDRARSTTVMPPETRVLVQLIERFRPSRIAAVHAHSIGRGAARPGNDPGIFVDPAIRRDAAGKLRTDPDRFDPAGDRLAAQLIAAGRRRLPGLPAPVRTGRADPFRGNTGATPTRYATSVPTYEGHSLGDWAPSLGIQTVTVEIPQYGRLGAAVPLAARQAVERLHRDVLLEVFLGVPPAPATRP